MPEQGIVHEMLVGRMLACRSCDRKTPLSHVDVWRWGAQYDAEARALRA